MKKVCLLTMILIFALGVPVWGLEVDYIGSSPFYSITNVGLESRSVQEDYNANQIIPFTSHDGFAVVDTVTTPGTTLFFDKSITVDAGDALDHVTFTFHVHNTSNFVWSDYHFVLLSPIPTGVSFEEPTAENSSMKGVDLVKDSNGNIIEVDFFAEAGRPEQLVDPGDISNFEVPFQFPGSETVTFDFRQIATSNGVEVPVPEPTTMLLLGSGLIGLWGARRKFIK